ncbi:MAG TPA: gliding motility-associated C-terminal domain-containing protein [Cytophagales bacterium]|nr:gliding motility-associated C-terminal domain-containing protein [Cytophagales bacterium]
MTIKKYIFFFISVAQAIAQTGPAGVGTNDGFSALKLWLDANVGVYQDPWKQQAAENFGRVTTWKDQSGSNNDLMAEYDSTRPSYQRNLPLLNEQSVIRFNRNLHPKNQRNYLISKSFQATSDITIYCVFFPTKRGGGNNVTPHASTLLSPNYWYYGSGLVDAGVPGPFNDISMTLCDSSLAAGAGDSTVPMDYTVKTPLVMNRSHFGMVQKEAKSGLMAVSVDGNFAATFFSGTQPINNPLKYYIGSTSDTKSDKEDTFFDGYIANILVYNKILNPTEKLILENYLSAKYDIPLPQNDLYTMDRNRYGNYDFDMAGIGKSSDGSSQLTAKGEGIVKISNPSDLSLNEYLFWAHNGMPYSLEITDLPTGVQQRLLRLWRIDEVGETGNVDITVDATGFLKDYSKDLVLLIDKNNDGRFSDERLGQGMIVASTNLGNGTYNFHGIDLDKEQQFTFALMDAPCTTDCDASFSPNGDGQSDTYLIETDGHTNIYNKYGQHIKKFTSSGYWDGTNASGEVVPPGLYFIVDSNGSSKTVTLVR